MTEQLEALTIAPASERKSVVRQLVRKPVAMISLGVIAVWVVVAILSPWMTPYPPNKTDLSLTNAPPSAEHLLGADRSGRDILSRLIAGAGDALESTLIATSVALVIGVVSGLLAGYFRRGADAVASWVANVLIAVPGIIVLIALYAAVGSSTWIAMVTLGFLLSPNFFRLTRAMVIDVKNELYVDAARVSGVGITRIIGRHIFAAVRAPLIVQASFAAGIAISLQAGLAFLGLSNSNKASWGGMLQEGFANLYVAPLQVVWPGIALGLTTSALVLFGNALRDTLGGVPPVPRRTGENVLSRRIAFAAPESPELLAVTGLGVAYPGKSGLRPVVDGVSLTVNRGEIVGLVGESGSGKTQTAFAILGLLPEEAVVTAGEMNITTRHENQKASQIRGRTISYIPQEPMSNLDPSFTVGRQLVYGIRYTTGMSKSDARGLARDLLARVGIADPDGTMRLYPHQISGGMAQRVLIAGAVASDPELLIADEPTTALDVTVQAEILELLRSLQRERDLGILLVTHNFGVVADLCDRVVVMSKGTVVESGETLDVFREPHHPYTQALLGSILDVEHVRDPMNSPTAEFVGETKEKS